MFIDVPKKERQHGGRDDRLYDNGRHKMKDHLLCEEGGGFPSLDAILTRQFCEVTLWRKLTHNVRYASL